MADNGDFTLRLDLLEARMNARFNTLDGQLQVVRRDLDNLVGKDGKISDHETRLRSVERWKLSLPLTILLLILSTASVLVGRFA